MSGTSIGGLGVRGLVRHYRPGAVLTRQLNTRYGGLPPSFFARSARIVDAGGGPKDALKAKRLFAQCWYEGINIEDLPPASRGRHGCDRYHLVDLDGTDLSFLPDRSYDLVVSSHTIEHLEDGAAVVARLCGKVGPDGLLYLEWPSLESVTFPIRGFGLRFDDDATHRHTYGLDEIRALVESQGLRVEFARRRRQWLRMILSPILVGYHSLRFRRIVLFDLWDVTGFCYALRARRPVTHPRPAPRPTSLRALQLICPVCREPLRFDAGAFSCAACGRTYPVVDGIPILVPEMAMTEQDEIDYLHGGRAHGGGGDGHKALQAAHFDRAVAEEFEIRRPHGTPRLYRFLLNEKFRRGTAPIGPHLVGASVLTVCGGSGMDAEFLARAGAHVVSSDLSLGAARRTRERARRYRLDITPIVADIEQLPFADGDFDLVLVHDGLHHLERPEAGLAEMARVAGRWVSVTEPSRAAATAVAVKLGIALEREEAGNRVARLAPAEIVGVLRAAGFPPLAAERYAMYYRHEPGSVFRALSRPGVFLLVRAGWRVGNALIGKAGNKMVVVAEREAR